LAQEVNEDFTEEKRQLLNLKKMLDGLEDEEAAVMKRKGGRSLPSYNTQSVGDGKLGVVCAVATRDESDKPEDLLELVDQTKVNTGKPLRTSWWILPSPTMRCCRKQSKSVRRSIFCPTSDTRRWRMAVSSRRIRQQPI
jgi:hypothetical protein